MSKKNKNNKKKESQKKVQEEEKSFKEKAIEYAKDHVIEIGVGTITIGLEIAKFFLG